MSTPALPLETLPDLPRDPQGPVFAAPWEAQPFALTLRLAAADLGPPNGHRCDSH